jgi:hypothetical protein
MDERPAKKFKLGDAAASAVARTVVLGAGEGARTVLAVGWGTLAAGVAYPTPGAVPDAAKFVSMLRAAAAAAAPFSLLVDLADVYCHVLSPVHGQALAREARA